MENMDLIMMLVGVIFVGFLIYKNIEKINANEGNEKINKTRAYENLTQTAINEIESMKNGDENFDEKLDDFIRELKHIKSMNQNSNDSVWSAKLGGVFMRVDEYLKEQNKELLAVALQNKLKAEFSRI